MFGRFSGQVKEVQLILGQLKSPAIHMLCLQFWLILLMEVYFVNISPKYNDFTINLHKWNKISILDFEYRSTLQIFIQIFVKICMF